MSFINLESFKYFGEGFDYGNRPKIQILKKKFTFNFRRFWSFQIEVEIRFD